jgi:hypothetical protein
VSVWVGMEMGGMMDDNNTVIKARARFRFSGVGLGRTRFWRVDYYLSPPSFFFV